MLIIIPIRISLPPVWRGHHILIAVFALLEPVFITRPRNALVRHLVRPIHLVPPVARGDIREDQIAERVVEDGVCDQAAGVVWFFGGGVGDEGGAGVASPQGAQIHRIAAKLAFINGLDVASVVLVKVGEAVVEVHRRVERLGDVELEGADLGVEAVDAVADAFPARGLEGAGVFEGGAHLVGGDVGP